MSYGHCMIMQQTSDFRLKCCPNNRMQSLHGSCTDSVRFPQKACLNFAMTARKSWDLRAASTRFINISPLRVRSKSHDDRIIHIRRSPYNLQCLKIAWKIYDDKNATRSHMSPAAAKEVELQNSRKSHNSRKICQIKMAV